MKEHMGKFGGLYILLALGVGLFIGSQWSKWFPKKNGVGVRVPTKQCWCGGVFIGNYPRQEACPC